MKMYVCFHMTKMINYVANYPTIMLIQLIFSFIMQDLSKMYCRSYKLILLPDRGGARIIC